MPDLPPDIGTPADRQIMDSAVQLAVIATTPDGRVVRWTAGAEAMLGWREEEIVGQSLERLLTADDRGAGRIGRGSGPAEADGAEYDERWYATRSGGRLWVRRDTSPLRGDTGEPIGHVTVLHDRTAEHLADTAFAAAQMRLRQAEEAGGIGLFAIDIVNDVLLPTPQFCRLYGLPVRSHYPASVIEDRVIAEDRHLVSTARSRAAGQVERTVEYRVRAADGEDVRWIARTGDLEFDETGLPVRFLGVARDVTEQRTARDVLMRSEERYRALFEAIDEGFCIIQFIDGPHGADSDYVHVEANGGYERHTGITGIVGKRLREIAPDEAEGWLDLYGGVLRTGQPIRFERDFVAVGRIIEVSAARVEPPSRRQVSVLFRDITERRQADAALRASEALARRNSDRVQLALAAGAIIGTWFWDLPNDRFTVDQAFARAFGLDPALGRDGLRLEQVVETVHPDDKEGLDAAVKEVIGRGGAYAHQYRVRRTDGRYYWIEANGRVEHGPDGTPLSFRGVLLDIEERRAVQAERDRATEELRALTEELEQRVADRTRELMISEEALRQSQKMDAVGQLTGGVAHDFNNLLTVIRGSVDLLRRENITPAKRARYIDAIGDTAERAAKLTGQLLAFARRQALRPEVFDARHQLVSITDMLDSVLGNRVQIASRLADHPCIVCADISQFETALVNMAVNARDAMQAEGLLTITVARGLAMPPIRGHGGSPGPFVAITLTDTGEGISAEDLGRIFEPFFTTKEVGKGTGLGLSQVFGFAKQSGGDVDVESASGAGTTFTLYLPEAEAGDMPTSLRVASDTASEGGGRCVLVVEDNVEVGRFSTQVLEDLGYRTTWVGCAEEALERLGASGDGFDVVFSDVVMPGMGGVELAKRLARTMPHMPVILATGYSHVLAQEGAAGFELLPKPYSADQLSRVLRRVTA